MSFARILIALLVLCAAAHADVYFEVVGDGDAPDGYVSHFPFFHSGAFDVYMWGDGDDTLFVATQFDITYEWLYNDFLIFDSVGAFAGDFGAANNDPGTIGAWAIEDAWVHMGTYPYPLAQGIENAVLLYDNFEMMFDGFVNIFPTAVETNNGPNATFHTIGVMTSPEPGSLTLLILAALIPRRRTR
ncbi:MAG: hypothetical protein ABIG44_04820 [Planctomycetota bacterium]